MIAVYLLLIITVLSSGSLVFLFRRDNRTLLKLLLAFSGAFLIGISFLDLVPDVFSKQLPHAGLFVLVGFLMQLLLELLTKGAEHGHEHEKDCHGCDEHISPFLLLLGLCIHSFLEGMPIVTSNDPGLRNTLVTGIIIHNIPISLTLMSLFVHYGLGKARAFMFLLIFALMTPLGSLFSTLLQSVALAGISDYFDYALAMVIGIFLHVSTSILFETSEDHQYNLRKFTTVVIGLATAYLVVSL
jgi:zinc and cadmium transporter